MSTIVTSCPSRAMRSAIPAPTRPQPMITARTPTASDSPFSVQPPACDRHALARGNGLRLVRRHRLTHDDDLARGVLEDVRNRRPDSKVAAEPLAVGQPEDDCVGPDLDRLVNERRAHLA